MKAESGGCFLLHCTRKGNFISSLWKELQLLKFSPSLLIFPVASGSHGEPVHIILSADKWMSQLWINHLVNGELCEAGAGRKPLPLGQESGWAGWLGHLRIPRSEIFDISESDSWWHICYLVLFLLQPLSKRHCRNLKRVTIPYRQAPRKPGTAHSCPGKLHRYVCSCGLCRGSNTACEPKGEKCRFGRWETSSCKMSLTSQGLSSNVSTSGRKVCSSIFSAGSSWIWPAWVYFPN